MAGQHPARAAVLPRWGRFAAACTAVHRGSTNRNGDGCRMGAGMGAGWVWGWQEGQLPPNQQTLGHVTQEAFPALAVPCGAGSAGPSPGSASSPRAPGTGEDGADQAAPQQEDGACSPRPC